MFSLNQLKVRKTVVIKVCGRLPLQRLWLGLLTVLKFSYPYEFKNYQRCQPSYMHFQFFSEKIEFTKLNVKIQFHEHLNSSWKVLDCNTGQGSAEEIHMTGFVRESRVLFASQESKEYFVSWHHPKNHILKACFYIMIAYLNAKYQKKRPLEILK